MRSTTAILGSIVMLFIGFFGLSYAAENVQTQAVTNGTNQSAAAYNTTTAITDGLGQAFAPAVVWMGVAAIILIALGYLVFATSGSR